MLVMPQPARPVTLEEIRQFVEERVSRFHVSKMEVLLHTNLRQLVRRQNPYLLQIRQVNAIDQLVRVLLDEHLKDIEENLFDELLRDVAVHVADLAWPIQRLPFAGIALAFTADDTRYHVQLKGSHLWKSHHERARVKNYFYLAEDTLRSAQSHNTPVRNILGICYGNRPYKMRYNYDTLSGAALWTFLSGNPHLYLDLIEPLSHQLDAHMLQYEVLYLTHSAELAREMLQEFCTSGALDWRKIVAFCSGSQQP